MSHGRIFVITDEDSLHEANYECPFDEVTMMGWISGCDYVCRQDNPDDFIDDLNWLTDSTDAKIDTVTLKIDGEEVLAGLFDYSVRKALADVLKKQKQRRLQVVREEINKEKPDMWQIAHVAYNNSCFYFVFTPDMRFENEMGAVDWLDNNKTALWYITEVYDYHT